MSAVDRTAHFVTFGCQMNRQESGVMAELLRRRGYEISDTLESAGVVIVETCAIRDKAEHKVSSLLGRLRRHREQERPDLRIVLSGCVVTPQAAAGLVRDEAVDVVLSPRRIARIADALDESAHGPVIDVGTEWAIPPDDISAPDIAGFSAFVTVMQGCSNACTFCVVPSRRGAAQSRGADAIVAEVRRLESEGYREVTLIGQNISYYGIDRGDRVRLIDLLERVEGETTIPRIRFATSHPAYIDRRFIDGFGRLKRVMPHLHLPIQSGSDRMLEAMNRGYRVSRYIEIADAVRAVRPETALTTDIIAGFDGETPEDHGRTLELVERVGFDGAYVYPYSERPGTPAMLGARGEPVPELERRRRCGEILARVEAHAHERRVREIGMYAEVLVEAPGAGRSAQNIPVRFEGGRHGEVERVMIESATPFSLRGSLAA